MDITQLFMDIVRIDSPSGFEQAISNYITSFLSRLKISSIVDNDGNMYAFIPGTGTPVVLSSHLDTVEPGRGIRPQIDKGVIKSDGTTILGADNKAAVAAILRVIEDIVTNNKPHMPIEMVFSVREETDAGIKTFDFSQLQSKIGYCFDSSGPIGNLVTEASYIIEFEINVTGKAAHGGIEPEKGINALTAVSRAISKLEWGRLEEGRLTANIGLIKGGDAVNTVPAHVSMRGDVRSIEEELVNTYLSKIEATFQAESAAVSASAEVVKHPYCNGYQYYVGDPLVKTAVQALTEIGVEPNFIRSNGGADANEFVKNGIAMINFGYGATDIHTTAEAMQITDLESLEKLVYTLVMKG